MKPTKFNLSFAILMAALPIYSIYIATRQFFGWGQLGIFPEGVGLIFYLTFANLLYPFYFIVNLLGISSLDAGFSAGVILSLLISFVLYYIVGVIIEKINSPKLQYFIIAVLVLLHGLLLVDLGVMVREDKIYREAQDREAVEAIKDKSGKEANEIFIAFEPSEQERIYTYNSDKAQVYELTLKGTQDPNLPDLQIIIYETTQQENVNLIIKDLLIRYRPKGETSDPSPTTVLGNRAYQNPDYRNMYLWSSEKYVIYFNTGTDEMVKKYFDKYPSDLK